MGRTEILDIPRPSDVTLSGVFRGLREDLNSLREQIDAARPLPESVVDRIANELTLKRVHQSNAIEGNTLSVRETVRILESGQLIDVGRKRESFEVINLGKAIEIVKDCLIANDGYADQRLFLQVHKVLFHELRDDIAGVFRRERVVIRGAKHQPPAEPQPLIQIVFDHLNQSNQMDPVVLATWCHWAIARIHPFEDGNGRMSRLWQDFILLKHQFTPAIIPFSLQQEYYAALAEADEGNFDSLLEMVASEAVRTSQTYLSVIRENDEALDWAKSLVGESEQQIEDQLKLEYSRWVSQVRDLREAFRRCVTLLNRTAKEFEFQVVDYDIVSQATWESLRSEPKTPQTWCFRLVARSAGRNYQYVVFAGKHFRNPADSELGITGPLVNLIVSEKCGPNEADILQAGNSPVRLREILILDGKVACGRWNPEESELVYDQNMTTIDIAKRFLEDVIRYRMTT